MRKEQGNPEVKIRHARVGDAPQLAELSGQLGYPTTTAEIKKRLRRLKPASQNALFVAESPDAGVVGWAHVSVTHNPEPSGLVLAGVGVPLFGVMLRRRRKATAPAA